MKKDKINEKDEKEYWAGEFDDKELDVLADQGDAALANEEEKAWTMLRRLATAGDIDSETIVEAARIVNRLSP